MNDQFKDALKYVANVLNKSGINWIIFGSTNFHLQGMDINPRDIDICINHNDFSSVMNLFSDFEFAEITNLPNGEGQERKFRMNNVEVQICADYDFGFYYKQMSNPENVININFEGLELPVLTLKAESECYRYLGREEKAKQIEEFIRIK